MLNRFTKTRLLAVAACVGLLSACSSADYPDKTHDGLTLMSDTKFEAVYLKPGADLASFDTLGLVQCEVAFKTNWLRDQNRDRMDLSNRVRQQDVDRIKDSLSAACDEQFHKALQEEPAYQITDKFDEGEHVLVLRPSITDLDVASPDVRGATRTTNYTTSAGEMTLSLDFVDATTGETLARVVDKRRAMDDTRLQWTNSVTNKAEATRILKRWAKMLREGLDEVRSS